ncbi:MAG: QueT transporter family protein, partial [Lachnospiraceae bacterium]|nr:QueT transporter family protein [Lachnospiraceae bacterium]
VSNMIIIPVILTYAYHIPGGIPFLMLTVGAGEVISCYVIGEILLSAINPVKQYIFGTPEADKADNIEGKNA